MGGILQAPEIGDAECWLYRRVAFCLHYACGIIAIVLLWAVYPRDFNYTTAVTNALQYFQASRIGALPAGYDIPWRGTSLLYEGSASLGFANLTGGWMNGGILGTIKLTQPAAYTTAMLAWGLLAFVSVPPPPLL